MPFLLEPQHIVNSKAEGDQDSGTRNQGKRREPSIQAVSDGTARDKVTGYQRPDS